MARDGHFGRWRAWPLPWGLIGAAVLVVCVETAVSRSWRSLASVQAVSMRFAQSAARSEAPGCTVIAVGDSTVKLGINPTELERSLGNGARAYNLAVPGTPAPVAWAVFRRAMDAGARPSAIIYGCLTLAGDPRGHVNDYAEMFTPAEAFGLAWEYRDPETFAKILVRQALPSLRYRDPIRETVVGVLSGTPVQSTAPGRKVAEQSLRDWAENKGAVPRVGTTFDGRLDPDFERELVNKPWPVHPLYFSYAHRIAKQAAREGITVFWLVPPLAPSVQARRDAEGHDAHHSKNLRGALKKIPNLVLLDARHSGYPAEVFLDGFHVNTRGAEKLSADVARAVRRHLDRAGTEVAAADRWVQLPAFSGAPDPAIATGPAARPVAR